MQPLESSLLKFLEITATERKFLNSPVLEQEICAAIFQMGTSKAPRLDGYPPGLYQQNWDIIKNDVVHLFKEAFTVGTFSTDMIDTLITLIPKNEALEEISQF